jgi:hypothetical protein
MRVRVSVRVWWWCRQECVRHFEQFAGQERAPESVWRAHPALLTCCVLPRKDHLAAARLLACLLAALRAHGRYLAHTNYLFRQRTVQRETDIFIIFKSTLISLFANEFDFRTTLLSLFYRRSFIYLFVRYG